MSYTKADILKFIHSYIDTKPASTKEVMIAGTAQGYAQEDTLAMFRVIDNAQVIDLIAYPNDEEGRVGNKIGKWEMIDKAKFDELVNVLDKKMKAEKEHIDKLTKLGISL